MHSADSVMTNHHVMNIGQDFDVKCLYTTLHCVMINMKIGTIITTANRSIIITESVDCHCRDDADCS